MREPMFQNSHVQLFQGDCREILAEMPENSVQCCITSPPYWGLRKYKGNQDRIWGGKADCEHEWGEQIIAINSGGGYAKGKLGPYLHPPGGMRDWQIGPVSQGRFCQKCGAWYGAFGLEPTVEMYVAHSIEILRAIRRVLREDGVIMLNLGDSYAGGKGQSGQPLSSAEQEARAMRSESLNRGYCQLEMKKRPTDDLTALRSCGLKPKDLCLIPWRVALAAQSDGWWVRSIIAWQKLNPMPESVTDRPTDAWEPILMLTKSRNYFYDSYAVREQGSYPLGETRLASDNHKECQSDSRTTRGLHSKDWVGQGTRNLRNVWTLPTAQFKGGHFAVFPEKLAELCIKAATSEKGNCPKCGKPWVRVLDKKVIGRTRPNGCGTDVRPEGQQAGWAVYNTLDWKPQCSCGCEPIPSVVLDPFVGSGTTCYVAAKLGRKAIGIDVSAEYINLAVERCKQDVLV
jgi:DNA modification methylase